MTNIDEWERIDNCLERTFNFDEYDDTIDFVDLVMTVAQEANHHPDIHIHYKQVVVSVHTHGSNEVTEDDLRYIEMLKFCQENDNVLSFRNSME